MSEMNHILALSTYGTQIKTHQGRRVSALKIGYTGPIARILLTLLPDAQDISSQRDRYVYIHIPNKPKLRHNWLFVEMDADELQRVEGILQEQDSNRGIALWRESQWQLLPYRGHPDYQRPRSTYDVPKGSPIGFWAINSAGETGATGGSGDRDQLIAEYSKLDPNKAAWWWLPGNDATYEQRFILKRLGCRWVRNRRAYAYIGDRLPEDLLDLLDNAEECRAIMNGMRPDEAQQTHRPRNDQTLQDEGSSEDDPMTPGDTHPMQQVIQDLLSDITSVRRPHPERLPIILTDRGIVAGQTEVGQDSDRKIVWYLYGNLSHEQTDSLKELNASFSIATRRWLIEDPDDIVTLNHHLARYENGALSDDNDPCSLEEAARVLGVSVAPGSPAAGYPRGHRAWMLRTLPAGIEGRVEAIPGATAYTITDIDLSDDPINPVYTIAYADDKTARVREEDLIPQRLFAVGDTVYARQETETADGQTIETGRVGTVTRLYRFNRNYGTLRGHSYDVDWGDVGVEWMFEDELSHEPTGGGIVITRGQVIPGQTSMTSADERRAILEANVPPQALDDAPPAKAGCTCEAYAGPQGWYPDENLGTWIACGTCNPTGAHMPDSDPGNPETAGPPPVRLIKVVTLPDNEQDDDAINRAIRQSSQNPPTSFITTHHAHSGLQRLPMDYVGELTGSVVANVYCYGYAIDQGELIYLNMGGPRSGVEAIRAKLGKGDAVNLIADDAPAIELTAGEGNTGMYTAIMSNISEARFTHCILVHEKLTDPNYNGTARTYIPQVDEAQAKGQLLHHIRETVSLPVFDDWLDYLWSAGQSAMLVRTCRSGGGLTVNAVDLDPDSWQRLITGGVGQGIIAIPPKSIPEPFKSGDTTA